jgi:hypothetical protein
MMKKGLLIFIIIWSLGAFAQARTIQLEEGWNVIHPGGETSCAHGDPFQFWIRPGSSDHLLVYFEGGGGCWSAETCRKGSSLYNQHIGNNDASRNRSGIFDFNHPDNPFADYTYVYVPSCTGDVYMGAKVQDYGEGVQIYHHGFINLNSVLQYVFETIEQPESIFVTGCSAGSPGSAVAAPRLIDHYPGVPVYQLGDSLGAIFDTPDDMQAIWGIEPSIPDWISEMPPADAFSMTDYYIALANFYPDYTFAQYNSLYDRVQRGYFSLGQSDPAEYLRETLDREMKQIGKNAPNFYSYTAEGDLHCITPRPEFYTYETNSVRFVDWISAYAQGETVETIHCENCDRFYND